MLTNDPFPTFPYLSLTQFGELFHVSNQTVGRWLKEIGLRNPNGEPSQRAKDAGYVMRVSTPEGKGFWSWRKHKTIEVLEAANHPLPDSPSVAVMKIVESAPPTASPKLVGPFSSRRRNTNDADCFEIVDAKGEVAVWVRGDERAARLLPLLDLCWDRGKFF